MNHVINNVFKIYPSDTNKYTVELLINETVRDQNFELSMANTLDIKVKKKFNLFL